MPGVIHRIVEKRLFDFSKPSIGSPQTQEVVLAKALPVHMWQEGTVVFRLHGIPTSWVSGASIAAVVREEAPTVEDPATDYIYGTSPTAPTALATATFNTGATAPGLLLAPLVFNSQYGYFGSHLRVLFLATLPANTPGTVQSLSAYLSLDLSLKS